MSPKEKKYSDLISLRFIGNSFGVHIGCMYKAYAFEKRVRPLKTSVIERGRGVKNRLKFDN